MGTREFEKMDSSGSSTGSDNATASPPRPVGSSLPAAADNGGDTTTNEEATETEEQEGRKDREALKDLHPEWLDEIRFMSYRTAAKLRLLQKRTGLVHIDIWNMIEAFRAVGLNFNIDPETKITRPRLETLVGSLYTNLSKRLTPNYQNETIESMASWLLSWLLTALNPSGDENLVNLKVRTLKTSLAVLSSGKLMDKLRYIFSLISDDNNHLVHAKYHSFVRDVVRVPRAVGEEFKIQLQQVTFHPDSQVTLNEFLEAMMSDPGPQSLSWLPVLHRIVAAENVVHHGIVCGSCGSGDFRGLRYKSDRSKHYHLCQWCFWRGKIPPEHRDDVFKEFNTLKNLSTSSGSSGGGIKKNLLTGRKQKLGPEPSQDASNAPAPSPSRFKHSPQPSRQFDYPGEESEHHLIAQYAQEINTAGSLNADSLSSLSNGRQGMLLQSRELVFELERKNQEIMLDIERLRRTHARKSPVMSELQGLRSHKIELENRLEELQMARKDLMDELDELMKLLKVQQPRLQQQAMISQHPAVLQMMAQADNNSCHTNIAGMGIEDMGYYQVPDFNHYEELGAQRPPVVGGSKTPSPNKPRKKSSKRLEKSNAIDESSEADFLKSKPSRKTSDRGRQSLE